MEYTFLDSSIDKENIVLPASDKINSFLQKNDYAEIIKAIDFLSAKESTLYIHGFLGTGKRQFINYISEFADKNVLKLEYYCKTSTVCDDILLNFIEIIESSAPKNLNASAKITTLNVKLQQYVSSMQKPMLIVLHSYDDIPKENRALINECFEKLVRNANIKIIVSTRAMIQGLLGKVKIDRKIVLKGLTKDIFNEYLISNKIVCAESTLEDFYKYTRGYYYYTALTVKIIQAMKVSINEFLEKFVASGKTYDNYLGAEYVGLMPTTIKNFFWFLRTVRHGLTLNTLAVYELYDEFSIEYLKTNLIIFQVGETLYVQDYFQQNIDIAMPSKTEIKLHKFIITIYEKELKEPLRTRSILMSRQAFRAEIDYHKQKISDIERGVTDTTYQTESSEIRESDSEHAKPEKAEKPSVENKINTAKKVASEGNYTRAIDIYMEIIDTETINSSTLAEIRLEIAKLYKTIKDFHKAQHYYELVERYYNSANEQINLNYLYYDLTELYFLMYKNERAIETIKKVIYSVDTPQSLMVSACTLLGNIYSDMNKAEDAYKYYEKALASLEENTEESVLAELYFKFALANDERGDYNTAFEYYTKCLNITNNNEYMALAYSNMGACYYENKNFSDASFCYEKAYTMEKSANNYDGVYYAASNLGKLYLEIMPNKALEFLIEAKRSAEFINEDYYIMESSVALGDYYYNNISKNKDALSEYYDALEAADRLGKSTDVIRIKQRIKDMELRMPPQEFAKISRRYGKN